jgi:hypothetical protein
LSFRIVTPRDQIIESLEEFKTILETAGGNTIPLKDEHVIPTTIRFLEAEEKAIPESIVTTRIAEPIHIRVEHNPTKENPKRYSWEVSVYGSSKQDILALIDEADKELRARYGGEAV